MSKMTSKSRSKSRSKSPGLPKSVVSYTAKQLSDAFHNHAVELGESKDPTAKFRSTSYDRVASKIESMSKKSKLTKADIDKLDISDHMKIIANKLLSGGQMKKVKSGNSSKSKTSDIKSSKSKTSDIKSSRPIDNIKLLKELSEFMGIGKERAKVLIEAGVKNVNSLHMKKYFDLLPEETKLFIKLKPLTKIPHEHIDVLKLYIDSLEKPDLKIRLVGSYRRGKPFSSDIDVMIVSDNENAIDIFYKALSNELDGKVYPYSKGKDKLSLIVDMTDLLEQDMSYMDEKLIKEGRRKHDNVSYMDEKLIKEGRRKHDNVSYIYKIDVFRTLPEDEIPMMLYSTGSKEFNVGMRGKAKKLGYLLNQKGLFKDGKKIENLDTEEDYFNILDMEYKEPKDRI
jgi:DNA polymerase/3'-5' exonuclease PolX